MPEFGLTDTGFNRKRLDTLLEELDTELRSIFGENFDVDPNSPQGQIDGTISESNANLWEIAQASYDSFRPNSATGDSLSELVQINNITRQPATPSKVSLTLSGDDGTFISSGAFVETGDTAEQFITLFDVTISGGIAIVDATSVNPGPITAISSTIDTIVNPTSGWNSVTNPLDADLGTNEETDEELRKRRAFSVSINAQNVIDAIFSRVSNIVGVTSVTVLENRTSANPDVNGLPPHSFEVIVEGGDDLTIAKTIFITRTGGVDSSGSTLVNIQDSQGFQQPIRFTRPSDVDIYVDLVVVKGLEYPVDGDAQIKQAIVDYAAGQLILWRRFSVGDEVIRTELYVPANIVDGVSITSLQIGVSALTANANIPIGLRELSAWDSTRINISV